MRIQLIMMALLLCSSTTYASDIQLTNYSQGIKEWHEKSFVGHTKYQLINDQGKTVIKASTDASASGLFREVEIDLNKTPYLNWSWKIDSIYQGNNERSKQGDDYPARIYVVVSGGLFFWKTKAINYVWSSNQPVGASWDNAYTGNAKMIAIRAGRNENGQWQTEKRNVREDLKRLFGEEINEINAIAIMSDSDNTKQHATAWYGDIFFSTE